MSIEIVAWRLRRDTRWVRNTDRMIGDYRLIVASSSRPTQKAMDYVCIHVCRRTPDGDYSRQIDPDLKLNYAQYAQAGWGRSVSTRPPEFQAKPAARSGGGGMAAFVNERLQIIRTDAMSPQAHVIACNRVQTADANILLTVQMPGWHGAGFYPADEWPENEHGWYATVGRDQMLGDERRLIDLRTIRQFPAHSLCSDQLYVIGCVSEQLKTVFQDRYENLKSINAAGENLSLVLWDLKWSRSLRSWP